MNLTEILLAQQQQPTGGGAGGLLSLILPFIILLAVFYFFIILPQSKEKKKRQKMLDSLKEGDTITTAGGLIGVIKKIDGDVVTLKVSEGTTLRIEKWAVSRLHGEQQ
ncbi:MAG: preprotein translocase subunit YajC [candidate division WOR-3 bacterium]